MSAVTTASCVAVLAGLLAAFPASAQSQDVQPPPPDAPASSFDDGYDPQAAAQFQSVLAPYGTWVDTPDYGPVWVPDATIVGADFEPYVTDGAWTLSDAGWTWVSNWDWGWAPFHYGRWTHLYDRGWAWVPGTVWGPAWVSWRQGGSYVGWAPLPPTGTRWTSDDTARVWRFVPRDQLGTTHPVYVPQRRVAALWAGTAPLVNPRTARVNGVPVRVNAGPTGAGHDIVPLASISSTAHPRAAIVPRLNAPLAARPWLQRASVTRQYTAPPVARPSYPQPRTEVPVARPSYPQPRPAAPVARPSYPAPRPTGEMTPPHRAPPPVSAPAPPVAAPAPHVSAPAPRPMYGAPMGGGPRRH